MSNTIFLLIILLVIYKSFNKLFLHLSILYCTFSSIYQIYSNSVPKYIYFKPFESTDVSQKLINLIKMRTIRTEIKLKKGHSISNTVGTSYDRILQTTHS